MINLDELKGILEPLDLSVEVLESIQNIDRIDERDKEIARLKDENEQIRKDYDERFRKAFFKNEGLVEQHDEEIVEQEIEQSEGDVNTDITFDELFK